MGMCFKILLFTTFVSVFFFSSIFSCCSKSGDEPQEDLAEIWLQDKLKSKKKIAMLLYAGESLEPIN
jgi:hypothetical protein